MARYIIQGDFKNTLVNKEIIDVVNPEIESTHVYRNEFTKSNSITDIVFYNQDLCLNRFDLNRTILDKIVETQIRTKLWTIDPEYLDLDMAIKLANMGEGFFISDRYKKLWEIEVIRYVSGERNFFQATDFYTMDRLLSNAEEAANDLEDYIYNFRVNHDGYLKRDTERYEEEEERALNAEDDRLNGKTLYCLDIMRDIAIAKNNVSKLRQKR